MIQPTYYVELPERGVQKQRKLYNLTMKLTGANVSLHPQTNLVYTKNEVNLGNESSGCCCFCL